MRRQDIFCLVAGVVLATAAANFVAPTAHAFRVFKVVNGRSVESDPVGCGPFERWNLSRFPDRKIPYYINSNGSADLSLAHVTKALGDAFLLWKTIPNTPIDFRLAGYTSAIGYNPDDNNNVIFWDESGKSLRLAGAGPEALALTVTRANLTTAELEDADIGFNGGSISGGTLPCGFVTAPVQWSITEERCAFPPKRIAKVKKWGAHEVGHLLGLAHSTVKTALMFIGPTTEVLMPDDVAGAKFLYENLPPPCSNCNSNCNSFLSFVEGNPSIPGDGVFVSAVGGMNNSNFDLSSPIPLNSTTDGFTVTVFPPASVQSVNQVVLIITNLQHTGVCQVGGGFGSGSPRGAVSSNGVRGFYFNVPQSTLNFAVNFLAQQNPGCGVTVNNLFVEVLFLEDNFSQPITTLDATAICPGQNNCAGNPL